MPPWVFGPGHEGGDGQAAGALAVLLAEELLLQLVGPPLVGVVCLCQVPNVSTLQNHLCNTHLLACMLQKMQVSAEESLAVSAHHTSGKAPLRQLHNTCVFSG